MAFATNPYYSVLTIDHLLVGGALTDFVFYVDDLPADAFAEIHSTGKDIRFTDSTGTTELPFDLRAIDTTAGTCEIMVKVPSVSAVTDTDIRIYYGDHTLSLYAASDTYGRNNVYTLFEAVFALDENTAGATGVSIFIDRTGNGYTGKDYADATGTTGKVGEGTEFDGSNDYIEFGANWTPVFPFSILMWISKDTDGVVQLPFNSDTTVNRGARIQFQGSNIVRLQTYDGAGVTKQRDSASTITTADGFTHLAGVFRSITDFEAYKNSASMGGSMSGTGAGVVSTTPNGIIGSNRGVNAFFDGSIDEFWIAGSDLGSAYISTLYESQNAGFGTFYSVGTKQTNPLANAFTPIICWF